MAPPAVADVDEMVVVDRTSGGEEEFARRSSSAEQSPSTDSTAKLNTDPNSVHQSREHLPPEILSDHANPLPSEASMSREAAPDGHDSRFECRCHTSTFSS